ncbi:MAG: hypothetical protein ACRD26_24215 [Vicinamibacterales bacterium]
MRIVALLLASYGIAACGLASTAAAQALPSEPVTFGGGRVVLGGEAAASIAPADTGFFNYSDYEHSTLRELRIGLTASVRANDRFSLLGELRTENFERLNPFAFYVRARPWRDRRLDIQAGRIPPTFGAFTRYAYGHSNPLIGYPLAYQYLTSLRADAVPADADELLRMRGRGWLSNFGVGNLEPARGLPLVTAFSWDTGVQVSTGWRALDVTAAVTNGSASNPRVEDDNGGKQVAARVMLRPTVGLQLATSFSHGQFGARPLVDLLPADEDRRFLQRVFGADLEYSRDHWMARADLVLSEWRIPAIRAPFVPAPLRALAARVEGRYTFMPGMYAAARVEYLGFNRIAGTDRVTEWDAPVTRVEAGGGYYLQRNLIARVSVQVNRRDGGRVRQSVLPALQLLYWF